MRFVRNPGKGLPFSVQGRDKVYKYEDNSRIQPYLKTGCASIQVPDFLPTEENYRFGEIIPYNSQPGYDKPAMYIVLKVPKSGQSPTNYF